MNGRHDHLNLFNAFGILLLTSSIQANAFDFGGLIDDAVTGTAESLLGHAAESVVDDITEEDSESNSARTYEDDEDYDEYSIISGTATSSRNRSVNTGRLDVLGVKLGDTPNKVITNLKNVKPNLFPNAYTANINAGNHIIGSNSQEEGIYVTFLSHPDNPTAIQVTRSVVFKSAPKLADFEKSLVKKYGEPTGVLLGASYLWNFDSNGRQAPQIGKLVQESISNTSNTLSTKSKTFVRRFKPCWNHPPAGTPLSVIEISMYNAYQAPKPECKFTSISVRVNVIESSGEKLVRAYGISLSNPPNANSNGRKKIEQREGSPIDL